MKCAVHPDADAVGYCRNCGKAMCAVCVRPVRDVLYCEDCLANVMGMPVTPPTVSAPGVSAAPNMGAPGTPVASGLGPSPLLAFFLGFLPGLGAFYNEQYGKGIIHLAIFLFLFIMGVDGAVSGGAGAALGVCPSPLGGFIPSRADVKRIGLLSVAGLDDEPLQ